MFVCGAVREPYQLRSIPVSAGVGHHLVTPSALQPAFSNTWAVHCTMVYYWMSGAVRVLYQLRSIPVSAGVGHHLVRTVFEKASCLLSQKRGMCIVLWSIVGSKRNLNSVSVPQFFWHFVHPAEDVPFVGWDPRATIRKLTPEDRTWLKARQALANFKIAGDIALTEAHRVEVYDNNAGDGPARAEPRAYILFKPVDVNGRLFSRAITVWYGIRDARISVDGHHLVNPPDRVSADDLRVRIIKDTWRQLARRPETDFYHRLSVIPPNECVGLPSIVCGGDLGEKEVQDWESALYGAPAPTPLTAVQHETRLFSPASPLGSLSSTLASLYASTSSLQLPVHRPMQQTFIWRQARGAK